MSIGALLQFGIVGVIVAFSLFHLFGRVAPRTRARLQFALADWLDQPQHPRWLRGAGTRLHPTVKTSGGCDVGCGSCNGCGSTSRATPSVQPLQFQRLPHRR